MARVEESQQCQGRQPAAFLEQEGLAGLGPGLDDRSILRARSHSNSIYNKRLEEEWQEP